MENFVGKKKLGFKLGVQEDVEFWLFSRNVWLKSETESEIDSSTGGVNSGKRELRGSIGWPKFELNRLVAKDGDAEKE